VQFRDERNALNAGIEVTPNAVRLSFTYNYGRHAASIIVKHFDVFRNTDIQKIDDWEPWRKAITYEGGHAFLRSINDNMFAQALGYAAQHIQGTWYDIGSKYHKLFKFVHYA